MGRQYQESVRICGTIGVSNYTGIAGVDSYGHGI